MSESSAAPVDTGLAHYKPHPPFIVYIVYVLNYHYSSLYCMYITLSILCVYKEITESIHVLFFSLRIIVSLLSINRFSIIIIIINDIKVYLIMCSHC